MNPYYYPQQYVHQSPVAQAENFQTPNGVLWHAAVTGAVIGAAGAAAANLHRLNADETTWQSAAVDVGKASLKTAAAAAGAAAVSQLFTKSSALSLAASLATGTAILYSLTSKKQEE